MIKKNKVSYKKKSRNELYKWSIALLKKTILYVITDHLSHYLYMEIYKICMYCRILSPLCLEETVQ